MKLRAKLGLLALVAAAACVSAAWAAVGGGTAPATFAVQLDSEAVLGARSYDLDAVLGGGDKREYTLRLSLQLTESAAPAQAFQSGQTFASASISLLAADLRILRTYTLANATVIAYRQAGDAGTNSFEQELVLRSRSLTIG